MAATLKKVLITIPEDLLSDVDAMLRQESNYNRSELIRSLLADYVKASKVKAIERQLVEGYKIMAGLNAELAEYSFDADASLAAYENYLVNSQYA